MDDRNRVMYLIVPYSLVLKLLNGRARLADLDLPPDALAVDGYTDFARRGLALLIHSAQFEPVPIGVEPPHLPPLRVEALEP